MSRSLSLLAALVCCATAVRAQQPRADTTMIFWNGQNAQLPDSAKSVLQDYVGQLQRSYARIVILDAGTSRDSMLVASRLDAVRGYLVRNGISMDRITVGTRGTGWTTDKAASGPPSDYSTLWIVMPPPGTVFATSQNSAAGDTIMVFWRGQNAQLPESAKVALQDGLRTIHRTNGMNVIILDTGSSRDSMLVATRLSAVRGYLMVNNVSLPRMKMGTRGTGWATDTVATGRQDPQYTMWIVMPPQGTGTSGKH